MKTFGVIFDMDGVVMNNNVYHQIAWRQFCEHYHIRLTDEELHKYVFGRVAKDTLEFIFKKELSDKEIDSYVDEKEVIYRELYRPEIRPLEGLMDLLQDLKKNGVPMAMATSAPPGNVDFTFRYIPLRKYLKFHLNASDIIKGKPDPEIYLKSVERLGLPPGKCFVFEDSLSGIQAALVAGTRVIGVSTTHREEELDGVEKVIPDFNGLNHEELLLILNKQ